MSVFICYTSIIAERDAGMLPERMDTSCWMGRVCAPLVIEDNDGDGMMDVLYLCDGARCAGCSREYCRHTTDLAHALHYDAEPDNETLEAKFDRYGDYWVERD